MDHRRCHYQRRRIPRSAVSERERPADALKPLSTNPLSCDFTQHPFRPTIPKPQSAMQLLPDPIRVAPVLPPASRSAAPTHTLRACLLALGTLLATASSALGAPIVRTYNPSVDTWVASNDSNNNGGSTALAVGGTAAKETFLRFRVNETAGTGTPTQAKLRLWQKSGLGSGATIQVFAANNRLGSGSDWAESMIWSQRPLFTTFLASGTSRTTAGYLDFILPDYISGPGDYTLRVRTSSATQHNFDSREAPNLPKLEITTEGDLDASSAYYLRSPVDILDVGELYRIRYQQSNPTVGTVDVENIGYFDVTKQPYGAKSDGSQDATWAIQRAVSEARDARIALYFPPGTYKVSRTIQMAQGSTPDPHEIIDGLRWSLREFPCVLLGSRTGSRSKFVIDTASTFFNNASDPKPVLRFWSRHKSFNPEQNTANTQYYQALDNIDVDLSGKAGAIGVDMDAAQGTILTNSTVTATGAHAGIVGGPGPGGYTYGVTVTGGKYGAYFERAHCPLIINSKFTGQTVYSIYHENRGPLTLVGVEVSGKRIKLSATNSTAWLAALNVIDSRLETTGGGLLIETDRSVSLTNTYLKNGSTTAAAITQTDPVGGAVYNYPLGTTGWRNVREFARGVNIVQTSGGTAQRVPYWINGTANFTTTPHNNAVNAGSVPAQFSAGTGNRHALPASPAFSAVDIAGGVINAKTTSLASGPITTAKLNSLIGLAGDRPIFIPRGEYFLDGTVNMVWNTRIFGVGPTFSILRAISNFPAAPMVSTGTATGAISLLADVKLLLPQNTSGTAYMLQWRHGQNSTVKNVGFDRRHTQTLISTTVPLVQINTDGGGKWAGLWIIDGAAHTGNGRFLHVSGTTQPLKFYMLNLEHCNASPQALFESSSNFDIYQSKSESGNGADRELYWFDTCTNFRAFGFGGIATPNAGESLVRLVGANNNHYMLTQIQYQQIASPAPDTYWRLVDNGANKVRGDQQAVLYKRGTPPNQ